MIVSAWRRINAAVLAREKDAATICAYALGEDERKGQVDGADMLTSRAAEYIRNLWNTGGKADAPAEFKKTFLLTLNAPPAAVASAPAARSASNVE